MNAIRVKLGTVQNMALSDRLLRWILGTILLGAPVVNLVLFEGKFGIWHGAPMLLSIYPFLTGYLGWDPFYQMTSYKTCGRSEKNQCGTIPFQIDAALGHRPISNADHDHSLGGSHH